jgi:hypothetical protein
MGLTLAPYSTGPRSSKCPVRHSPKFLPRIEITGLGDYQGVRCNTHCGEQPLMRVTFARVNAATAWASVGSDARCRSLAIKPLPTRRLLASAEQAVREAPGTTFTLADLLARPVPRFGIVSPSADAVQRGGRTTVKIAVDTTPDPVKAIRVQVNGRQAEEETPDIGMGGFGAGAVEQSDDQLTCLQVPQAGS